MFVVIILSIKMLEFLIDNIYVKFSGQIFQQTVDIPMGTNHAPYLPTYFFTGMRALKSR